MAVVDAGHTDEQPAGTLPPVPAIDSVISVDEDAVPAGEEISNFELTEPKDKEYDAGELARQRPASASCARPNRVRSRPADFDFQDEMGPGLGNPDVGEIVSQGLEVDERITVKATTGNAMVPARKGPRPCHLGNRQ